jgi:hypothetical protein
MEFLLKVVEDNIINEYEFIDVITQLSDKKISILINEGPDLNKIKLFGKSFIECLQIITKNLKIKKNNITLITYNLVQDLSIWPNIKIIHPVKYFSSAKNFNIIINKNISKHFGIFVGGSRWHRLYIASNIFANHKTSTKVQDMAYEIRDHVNDKLKSVKLLTYEYDNSCALIVYQDTMDKFNKIPDQTF